MDIVFLGPPGAGKGTQAARVAAKLSVPHISTGDMFRSAITQGTPVGLRAKAFIDRGELVPDDVTIDLVRERLSASDARKGYLLDGFPRTVFQAEALHAMRAPAKAVNLEIGLDRLTHRLSGRRTCASCGEITHIVALAGKTACPKCGGALNQREDDKEDAIRNRLEVYTQKTAPLVAYYRGKDVLVGVDADAPPDEVFARVMTALGRDA